MAKKTYVLWVLGSDQQPSACVIRVRECGSLYYQGVAAMKRLDYWRAKLPAARAEERIREKELNQMARAFQRAVEQVSEIEKRIENEKTKLART